MLERRKSLDIVAHERLLVRLPEYHAEWGFVKEKLYQLESGFSGEVKVDEVLSEIPFTGEVRMLADISFECFVNRYIQIDTLIVTRKAIFLLEIKNYAAGEVEFDDRSGKTVHTTDRHVKRYDCVVDQVDRHVQGLKGILRELRVELPVYPMIVMANGGSIVERHPQNVVVKYVKQLPRYMRLVLEQLPEVAGVNVERIYRALVARSYKRPLRPLCQRYKISYHDLRKGVLCRKCGNVVLKERGSTWTCQPCQLRQKDAAIDALKDWFYLVDNRLTNREAREFLGIGNVRIMSYLLKRSALQRHGELRHAYYCYPYDDHY